MSLIKSFTDASGNVNATAFWRAVQLNISSVDKNINLVFYGYKDAASFVAGKQALPGTQKTYTITGDEFLAVATQDPVGDNLYNVLAHASEDYALNKLDTDSGEVDEEGQPILVSFFDGAQVV